MKQFVDVATRLVGIESVTTAGTENLANYLSVLMQARGLSVQTQEVRHSIEGVSQRQFNVLGVVGDPLVDRKTRKGLLLMSHIDTATPGAVAHWTEGRKNPFHLELDNGTLTGLGVADAKLSFLCQLEAISQLRDAKFKVPVYLAGTCGEEMGTFGAKYLLQSGAVNPQRVLVGKPTQLRVVTSHPTSSVFEVQFGYSIIERGARGFNRRINLYAQGRAGHPAYPRSGESALSKLLEFVSNAVENGFELKFTKLEAGSIPSQIPDWAAAEIFLTSHQLEDFKRYFREAHAASGGKTFRIELGGTGDAGIRFLPAAVLPALVRLDQVTKEFASQNVAAGSMLMTQVRKVDVGTAVAFDVRLSPEIDAKAMQERLFGVWNAVAREFPKLNLRVNTRWSNPGLSIPEDHEWVRQVQAALGEAHLEKIASKGIFGSEASLFGAKGYDTVVFGPGMFEGNAHCPNENVSMQEVEKTIKFYETLIRRVCL